MTTNLKKTGCGMFLFFVMAASVLMLTGCQTADSARQSGGSDYILRELSQAETSGKPRSLPDTRVTLAPGDLLEVKFFYTPELNEAQQVRPDGKITLQLAGDVKAAGLTPAELQKALEQKYTGLIENPSVAVIVRELNHRNVYVGGSVNEPGMLSMPGHMTALGAIMEAGGFDLREAKLENVLVIRHENDTRTVFSLDVRDTLKGDTPPAPFYLHPQDIVYVPRTTIVNVGQWIDQHINRIVPQTGFTYFYTSGDHRVGVDTSY
jgi:protein involved in polysaccharide export with SLBB domain